MSTKSPDWFARSVALVAIVLTVIGLYFTHRTYNFQTKTYQEGLEERILVRLGLDRDIEKSDGYIAVQVVNIGIRPIYIKAVRIDMPNGCDLMHVKRDPDIPSDSCGLGVYGSFPNALNPQPVKPLEPGDETDYSAPWDFSKHPIHDWIMDTVDREHLWAEVVTTKKVFHQHPIFSWYTMSQTIPQKYRSSGTRNKGHQ